MTNLTEKINKLKRYKAYREISRLIDAELSTLMCDVRIQNRNVFAVEVNKILMFCDRYVVNYDYNSLTLYRDDVRVSVILIDDIISFEAY